MPLVILCVLLSCTDGAGVVMVMCVVTGVSIFECQCVTKINVIMHHL